MNREGDAATAITKLGDRGRTRTGVIERSGASRQIRAGAKRMTGSGDDHRADPIISIGTLERVDELLDHHAVDGVEAIGTAQSYVANPLVDVINDGLR